MDMLRLFNGAMDYIEQNLEGRIDYDQLARLVCSSQFQFARMFSFLAGVPLSEYIRRRRMTLAAFELQNSEVKVIDLALKYGYESPEAFTRAFVSVHGMPPSAARTEGVHLKAYPQISFQITIQGVTKMDYRIVEREAFTVYGIERIFDMTGDRNLIEIPRFWKECYDNGEVDKLGETSGMVCGVGDSGRCPVGGLCSYESDKLKAPYFPYMLFVEKTEKSNSDGYTEVVVPASTWAVFRSEEYTDGDGSVTAACQNLYKRIYGEWFPTASYTLISGYELEIYYWSKTGKTYMEVWLRVQPK
ncbi:AraC family transcriptional regulator [Acetanaerobacterium elongatum]|uniref:AraC family transcriptional regulator n=1 Tax=Acetanaerobacterium elongatum TaxID=258515 RepID=A0A1G9V5Q4_9FIRM|nr:AraC family transcriptional regulator [Acetanaerobacterium elongatum]SDM67410.1 AraC family transcriptional regulator [Acetanaerobacterium elongatum]